MSSANAGWFLSPLRILLPLLALPFLLAPEANLTTSTPIIPDTTEPFMETDQPMIGTTGWFSVVAVTMEEPTPGVPAIRGQGPESTSAMAGQATLQRSENHTEAATSTGTTLDATSHVPEAEASPTASYDTEYLLRSISIEFQTEIVSEATTPYATPFLAITNTLPALAAAATSGSPALRSSEAFATSRSSAAPDAPTRTRPPDATAAFSSVLTTPSPTIKPDSSSVWSTRPALISVTPRTPTAMGLQQFPVLWMLVALLAVVTFVGIPCLYLLTKRRRKRSRVLHLGSQGYSSRRSKGKESDAWAGPVAISSMAAKATEREEAEDEEEEKRKGGGEEEVLLSTFGVEGTGKTSPNGRTGSTGARKGEEESPLLFIAEGQVEAETKAGANNLEGGGGGEVEEKEKEKEKDGKGLNGSEQTNGGTSFCYITAV